jgi:predicted deacylase
MLREYELTPKPTYQELEARWKALRSRDARVREVACVGAPRTLLCVELGSTTLPMVSLSAGVHGDEPAGPLALLQLAEDDLLDPRFSYRIWACTNPTGFDAGTRVNVDGIDINRTFGRGGSSPEAKALVVANRDLKFSLAIDLHEDDEGSGFYCYAYGGPAIGEAVIRALRENGEAIDPRGCLRPNPVEEAEAIGGLSLSLLLARNAAERALTFETDARGALPARVATHCTAIQTSLAVL